MKELCQIWCRRGVTVGGTLLLLSGCAGGFF